MNRYSQKIRVPARSIDWRDVKTLPLSQIRQLTLSQISAIAFKLSCWYDKSRSDYIVDVVTDGTVSTKCTLKNTEILWFGLSFGSVSGTSAVSRYERLCSSGYVFDSLCKLQLRYNETYEIWSHDCTYSTPQGVEMVNDNIQKSMEHLASRIIRNTRTGSEFSLLTAYESAQKSSLCELTMLTAELSKMASKMSYRWLFVTITAPGRMHPAPKHKSVFGDRRKVWDQESTPKTSSDFVQGVWRQIQKNLMPKTADRLGALHDPDNHKPFGFWSKEPHRSAAVHMHNLMFLHDKDVEAVESMMLSTCETAFKNAGGSFKKDISIKIVRGVPAKYDQDGKKIPSYFYDHKSGKKKRVADPASYLFKYVLKALCRSVDDDKDGTFESQRAHNKIHGYRRYDSYGVKSVLGLWRSVLRIERQLGYSDYDQKVVKDDLFKAVESRDLWAFVALTEGDSPRLRHVLDETPTINFYGEAIYKKIGIIFDDVTYLFDKYEEIEGVKAIGSDSPPSVSYYDLDPQADEYAAVFARLIVDEQHLEALAGA